MYNYAVLTIWVLFQIPAFPCAGSQEETSSDEASGAEKRYYIPAAECTLDQVERGSVDESLFSLYIVIASSFGLSKF